MAVNVCYSTIKVYCDIHLMIVFPLFLQKWEQSKKINKRKKQNLQVSNYFSHEFYEDLKGINQTKAIRITK